MQSLIQLSVKCNTPVRQEDRTFWIRTSAACIARGHSTKELLSQLKRPTVLIRYMSAPVYVVNTYNNRGHQMIASRSPLNNQTPAIRMFESCRGHHYGETWPEISPILHSPTFNKASWDRYFSAGIRTRPPVGRRALYQRAVCTAYTFDYSDPLQFHFFPVCILVASIAANSWQACAIRLGS
jgi:hypothetical protein